MFALVWTALVVLLAPSSQAATATWDGGSAVDSNWTTPQNWVGDVAPLPNDTLEFPAGAARLTNVNDFPAGTAFSAITLTGGGYTLAGNAIVLDESVTSDSASANTIALSLTLGASISITVAQADLNLVGALDGPGNLTKVGAGTLTLNGNSPAYARPLFAVEGSLLVNANFSSSNVIVDGAAALLGGTGTVNDILAYATSIVSPGASPGRLSATVNAIFVTGALFAVEINGVTAGTQYDQLAVTGAVGLNDAVLSASLGFTPPLSSTYTILTAAQGVFGAFAGLPPYAFLSIGGHTFQIQYNATSVVLVRTDPQGAFFTVAPCRLIDTRNAPGPFGGPALVAGISRTFVAAGSCGIPPEATAVVLNVTVVSPTTAGNLRIFPTGAPVPTVSALNYSAGQTRGNNGIFPLDATGQLDIRCAQATGTAHVVVDVTGYFVE